MEKLHLLHSLLASLTCMSSANQYSLRTIDSAWIRPNISFVPVRSITACILKYNLQLRIGGESAMWQVGTNRPVPALLVQWTSRRDNQGWNWSQVSQRVSCIEMDV